MAMDHKHFANSVHVHDYIEATSSSPSRPPVLIVRHPQRRYSPGRPIFHTTFIPLISIPRTYNAHAHTRKPIYPREVKKLQEEGLKPQEQLTLEPYERDHAVVVGVYRPVPKK
ncbi:hypothetical protein EON63_18785 [archaeon]|nr:MAG: hypothetical protein EON63_18785 [archaeon]